MGIGRKGRSCAWPPSRRVTSKSPMHAGVASSLDRHARVARRARQRRRVYQSSKKGHEPRRAGRPAGASVAGGEHEGSTAPGAASAARAGVRISFAGRSAVFRRRRFGPALLRKAPRCSCPAVACGDRGVSKSTWAAGLLFGADGVAVTVSVDRTARDASQATATTSIASTVSASMQDICRVPSCPASFPNVSRDRRLPCLDVRSARDRAPGASGSIRPHRPSIERHGASVPTRVHLPPASPPYSRIVRPRFGTWASPSTSYGCRARTGFPPAVWSHQSVGMAPNHAATGRLQHGRYNSVSTKAAPELSSYHPCRCCAPGRFRAPSLPDPRTRRHAAEDDFGRFRAPDR